MGRGPNLVSMKGREVGGVLRQEMGEVNGPNEVTVNEGERWSDKKDRMCFRRHAVRELGGGGKAKVVFVGGGQVAGGQFKAFPGVYKKRLGSKNKDLRVGRSQIEKRKFP